MARGEAPSGLSLAESLIGVTPGAAAERPGT